MGERHLQSVSPQPGAPEPNTPEDEFEQPRCFHLATVGQWLYDTGSSMRALSVEAERPAQSVELKKEIAALEMLGRQVRDLGSTLVRAAKIVHKDLPLSTQFPGGNEWEGVLTPRQLDILADLAEVHPEVSTTTYSRALAKAFVNPDTFVSTVVAEREKEARERAELADYMARLEVWEQEVVAKISCESPACLATVGNGCKSRYGNPVSPHAPRAKAFEALTGQPKPKYRS